MVYSEVSQKIRELRNQRGLTQAELGKMLGVSKSVISAYENGIHQPPYDVLIHLAGIFNVSCDYLLGVERRQTLDFDGLSEQQIELIQAVIDELRQAGSMRAIVDALRQMNKDD